MRKFLLVVGLMVALISYLTVHAADVTFAMVVDETIGVIEDVVFGDLHVAGEALTPRGLDDVIVELGDAPVFDLLTGLPVPTDIIVPGMDVRVAYLQQAGAVPQAVAVWLHPSHEGAAVFTTMVGDSIYYGAGHCVFLSADGRYRITLTEDTEIFCPDAGALTPQDVVPGQVFFVWVDMITASSPALVYPDKVVSICP